MAASSSTSKARRLRVMACPYRTKGNPYTNLLYQNMPEIEVVEFNGWALREEHFDIVHIHWPEDIFWQGGGFFAVGLRALHFIRNLYLGRKRGTKLLWTVHNFKPHEFGLQHALIWPWFWPLFLSNVDAIVSLCQVSEKLLLQRFPRLRSRPRFVIRHGHYRTAYPNEVSNWQARRHLGISRSATVIGAFGMVREYKNVLELIYSFRRLNDNNVILIIAGPPISDHTKDIVLEAAKRDRRIICDLRFIVEEDVQHYLKAMDLMVLPFAEILNSGSILLGLSFDRPVFTRAIGALPELAALVGNERIRTFDKQLTPDKLRDAITWTKTTPARQQHR